MATVRGNIVTIEGADEVHNYLLKLPEYLAKDAKLILASAALEGQKEVRGNFNSTGNISSNHLTSRTGLLAKSLKVTSSGEKLSELSASFFSDVIYAPTQETGGTITAKNAFVRVPGGPYLAIPLDANKTRAGVARYSVREVFQMGGFLFLSKAGNWLIGITNPDKVITSFVNDKWKNSLGIDLMFSLKHSVKIPPRLGMIKAAEKQVPIMLDKLNRLSLDYK